MPSRRFVLIGLAGAIGINAADASKKAQRKKKKGQKRMWWCLNHPSEICGCSSCTSCYKQDCCIEAYHSWGRFNACVNAL